ncbi:MAG: VOC family protein [Pseudomonadota bacterium]
MAVQRIAQLSLATEQLERSVAFYRDVLGMAVQSQDVDGDVLRCIFGFAGTAERRTAGTPECARLELVYDAARAATPDAGVAGAPDGYWKVGVTVPDVDRACHALRMRGVAVSEPQQFRDIGYLCHLADADGHTLELLQHRFAAHFQPVPAVPSQALLGQATLAHISLRITDPARSLAFYRDGLGLHLLSVQAVEPHGFNLYFLGVEPGSPPNDDWASVAHREWLWQRSDTLIELQHVWHPERRQARYATGSETGFLGVTCTVDDPGAQRHAVLGVPGAAHRGRTTLTDPDGYAIHLVAGLGTDALAG